MTKRLFDLGPGYTQWWIRDPVTQEITIQTTYEHEPLLAQAKTAPDVTPKRKAMRHVAIIPQSELDRSMREGWYHDQKHWRKWANDSDNSKWRTSPGRV